MLSTPHSFIMKNCLTGYDNLLSIKKHRWESKPPKSHSESTSVWELLTQLPQCPRAVFAVQPVKFPLIPPTTQKEILVFQIYSCNTLVAESHV